MGFSSGPKAPQPDPELARQRQEAADRAAKELADQKAANEADDAARKNRQSGRQSLLGGSYLGFERGKGLGA